MDDVNLLSRFPTIQLNGGYPVLITAPDDYTNLNNYMVGVHEHCEVLMDYGFTRSQVKDQFVNHVLCAALPFGYTVQKCDSTLNMNRHLLRAQYRLTILNALKMKSSKLFLTCLGAGAYGMGTEPAMDAIRYNADIINANPQMKVYLVTK